jgi:hypothetical protein
MSRTNPLWGAPRIHGELLKIGIEVSQVNQMLQIKLFEVQNFQHFSLLRLHVRVARGH